MYNSPERTQRFLRAVIYFEALQAGRTKQKGGPPVGQTGRPAFLFCRLGADAAQTKTARVPEKRENGMEEFSYGRGLFAGGPRPGTSVSFC